MPLKGPQLGAQALSAGASARPWGTVPIHFSWARSRCLDQGWIRPPESGAKPCSCGFVVPAKLPPGPRVPRTQPPASAARGSWWTGPQAASPLHPDAASSEPLVGPLLTSTSRLATWRVLYELTLNDSHDMALASHLPNGTLRILRRLCREDAGAAQVPSGLGAGHDTTARPIPVSALSVDAVSLLQTDT